MTHCPLARNVTKKTHKTMCVLEKVVRALLTGSQGLITYAKIGMRVGSSEERRNSLASTLSAMFFANEETKIGMVVLHVKYLRIFFPSRFSTLKAQFYGLFWGAVRQLDLNSGVNKNKKRKKRPVRTHFFHIAVKISHTKFYSPTLKNYGAKKKLCEKNIFHTMCRKMSNFGHKS